MSLTPWRAPDQLAHILEDEHASLQHDGSSAACVCMRSDDGAGILQERQAARSWASQRSTTCTVHACARAGRDGQISGCMHQPPEPAAAMWACTSMAAHACRPRPGMLLCPSFTQGARSCKITSQAAAQQDVVRQCRLLASCASHGNPHNLAAVIAGREHLWKGDHASRMRLAQTAPGLAFSLAHLQSSKHISMKALKMSAGLVTRAGPSGAAEAACRVQGVRKLSTTASALAGWCSRPSGYSCALCTPTNSLACLSNSGHHLSLDAPTRMRPWPCSCTPGVWAGRFCACRRQCVGWHVLGKKIAYGGHGQAHC